AAYPGCTTDDMRNLQRFTSEKLHIHPEQVQIFTPTPSTYATLMYYTEMDPFTRQKLYVARDDRSRTQQKKTVVSTRRQQGQNSRYRPKKAYSKGNTNPKQRRKK
ncbi:MAG: DUF3362 domain-containing protein, partial [Anaerolineaceae bacterium]|nr:DUF3362 domain-containing protein [Anaerolineaceae bacterium]